MEFQQVIVTYNLPLSLKETTTSMTILFPGILPHNIFLTYQTNKSDIVQIHVQIAIEKFVRYKKQLIFYHNFPRITR